MDWKFKIFIFILGLGKISIRKIYASLGIWNLERRLNEKGI